MKRMIFVVGLALLAGCGTNISQKESGVSGLRRFQSDSELVSYFRTEASRSASSVGRGDLVDGAPSSGGEAPSADGVMGGNGLSGSAPGSGGSAEIDGIVGGPDFSDTTTQEEGVDEADVVKTDGSYLYIIDEGSMRIIDVRSPEQITEVGRVELEGMGQDMFLMGDKAVALTQIWGHFYADVVFTDMGMGIASGLVAPGNAGSGDASGSTSAIEGPSLAVTVIDIADRSAPKMLSTIRFEGTSVSSRMIGERLHLAAAVYPYDLMMVFPLGMPQMRRLSLRARDIIPNYEYRDASGATRSGDMLQVTDIYRPIDPDGYGMVSVISLDIGSPADFKAVGVMANPGTIYASLNAFYLTDTEWTFFGTQRETTDIYKFVYTDEGVELGAVGSVPGRVLNQYSLGEHDGYLRIATTSVDASAESWTPKNHVYVLGQNGESLDIVGRVEDIAPGETLQSARFVGTTGYVVTFLQTDPLFTLDLSDPTAPRVVGELIVPGFSTFILPMDDQHLLTVGQYIPDDPSIARGVQLSIFDVSDLAAPSLAFKAVIGEGAWSEAMYNPKALTYFPEGGRVALPVTVPDLSFYDNWSFARQEEADGVTDDDDAKSDPSLGAGADFPIYRDKFQGLYVYDVSTSTGFTEIMRINTQLDDIESGWPMYPWYTRGVFIGDRVYAVTNLAVVGRSLSDPGAAPVELRFVRPEVEGSGGSTVIR